MTPAELRDARLRLDFETQGDFAKALRMRGKHAAATVSRWETGERPIPGWVTLVVELMLREKDRGGRG